ncbi:hypothetical protein SCOR_24645 [Sulfidibacter corallicola]|uniref:SbsA Ig-like domain-containing protein n=1 Tax=Sulfidibacter corallicola TaxID=2818388 RepID=A0A8A4TSB2_SULCO|nr:Ig-like domain-containing protein [Sulfidibacter corallicola]QTD52403.1 hypothetical protein J3U87_08010 [Sulfidibacter corallicola]
MCCLLVTSWSFGAGSEPSNPIRFDTSRDTVAVQGLSSEVLAQLKQATTKDLAASRVLSVYFTDATERPPENLPAIMGTLVVTRSTLTFQPRFPFTRGHPHLAVFDGEALALLLTRLGETSGSTLANRTLPPKTTETHRFSFSPIPKTPVTKVESIYPRVHTLPANQLKLYVGFSRPMTRGNAYRHIQLLDQDGQPAKAPFVVIQQELWDPEGKRLTLFFDPGRIKRGVEPRLSDGLPLKEGTRYTLTVAKEMIDGSAAPLVADHRFSFEVGPEDHDSPDPNRWQVSRPTPGTLEPLTLHFDEAVDIPLALRLVSVVSDGRTPMPGTTQPTQNDQSLLFVPGQAWKPGTYTLLVDTRLEDLAGNNLVRAFDMPLRQNAVGGPDHYLHEIPFRIDDP